MVTGGPGYIGSHTVVELLKNYFKVIIIDDLSNSEQFILDRIEQISRVRPAFYKQDLCKLNAVERIFNEHNIDVVIHFAA